MRMQSIVTVCALKFFPVLIVAIVPAGFAHEPEKHNAGQSETHTQTPPSEGQLESLRRECSSDKYKFSYEKIACLKPYVQGVTMLRSTRQAMRAAQALKRDKIVESCHHLAHFIGEANLEKNGYDVGRSLASCTLDCIQGCVHGTMQTYVAKKVKIENLASELRRVCDSVADDKLLRRQCVHGVGHGFLTLNYLPIAKAIEACRDGFRSSEIETCLGGLFMENMQKYLLWPEDQLREFLPKICADVYKLGDEEFTRMCNDGIGEGLMFYTGHDLEKSLALCELLPAPHQHACQYAAVVEENMPREE